MFDAQARSAILHGSALGIFKKKGVLRFSQDALGLNDYRPWSPISPETTVQKLRKAPAATSMHHMVRASSGTRTQHRGTRTQHRGTCSQHRGTRTRSDRARGNQDLQARTSDSMRITCP